MNKDKDKGRLDFIDNARPLLHCDRSGFWVRSQIYRRKTLRSAIDAVLHDCGIDLNDQPTKRDSSRLDFLEKYKLPLDRYGNMFFVGYGDTGHHKIRSAIDESMKARGVKS